MRKSGWVFPRSRLLTDQLRPCHPRPGAIGCCFPTGYCYILTFLHRAKLPLWRKYQLLGSKEPRKLSSPGSHSIGANPPFGTTIPNNASDASRVRAEGKGEKYVVSIPAYACKENLKQTVKDGMLIRNRNFVQSTEMVCSQLLCTSLISLQNCSFILMRYFAGGHGHPEHDLLAPRVLDSAKGCGEVMALRPIGRF